LLKCCWCSAVLLYVKGKHVFVIAHNWHLAALVLPK